MKTIYVYKTEIRKAENGSEYKGIESLSLLLLTVRTIQDVKDTLDKRANYKSTSTKKISKGEYTFRFNGREYFHTVK